MVSAENGFKDVASGNWHMKIRDFFHDLPPGVREKFLEMSVRKAYSKNEIIFFELYADDDASNAHRGGEAMKTFQSGFAENFDVSQVKIERLERVAGVLRSGAAT